MAGNAAPRTPKTPRRAASSIATLETMAFVSALLVNFVDQMGPQFTMPVLIPYGTWIGASLDTIALFTTARGIAAILSNLWMPKVSDILGSRKLVALMSLVGCAAGYFIQGIAYTFDGNGASLVFMLGRFTAGFFCGMAPVLQAYITELSAPDMTLMTQRLVMLQVAAQIAGLALAPISGSLATFGLQLPFFVCAGIGACAILFVLVFFREVKDIKGTMALPPRATSELEEPLQQAGDSDAAQVGAAATQGVGVQSASFAAQDAMEKKGSPLCDPVIGFLFLSYMFLFVLIAGGTVFLMPVMLQNDKFGIEGKYDGSEEEFQGNIAKVVGLCTIPNGAMQVICAVFLFVPLTTRIGELPVIVSCGIIVTVVFPMYGILATKIWQVAVLNGIVGCCFGFLTPALGPVCARYASVAYPKQMAMAQGIPMVGLQVSVAFSQNIIALLIPGGDNPSLIVPWCACGVSCALFCVSFTVAWCKADAYIKPKIDVSVNRGAVQAEGDVSAFIDECCAQLKLHLQDNQECLWNKHIQFVVQENLSSCIPQVAVWNEETHGKEHLEDTLELLSSYPEEQANFRRRFPHIGLEAGAPMLSQQPNMPNMGTPFVSNVTVKRDVLSSPLSMRSPINQRAFSSHARIQNAGAPMGS